MAFSVAFSYNAAAEVTATLTNPRVGVTYTLTALRGNGASAGTAATGSTTGASLVLTISDLSGFSGVGRATFFCYVTVVDDRTPFQTFWVGAETFQFGSGTPYAVVTWSFAGLNEVKATYTSVAAAVYEGDYAHNGGAGFDTVVGTGASQTLDVNASSNFGGNGFLIWVWESDGGVNSIMGAKVFQEEVVSSGFSSLASAPSEFFPVMRQTKATAGNVATATAVVTMPSGVVSGDLLLLLHRSTVGTASHTCTGWTNLFNDNSDASDDRTSLWYKVAAGSDTASVGQTSSRFSSIVWRVNMAELPSTQAPEFATLTTGTSTTPDPGTCTPTGGAKDYMWLWAGGWEGKQTSPPASNPTNFLDTIVGAYSGASQPTFVAAGAGATDAAGAWSYTGTGAGATGRLMILQVLQCGVSSATAISVTSVTNIENIAGTDNVMTALGSSPIGSTGTPTGYQYLFFGRSLNTTAPVVTGANTGADDVYIRMYEFADVNAGTTLAAILENATAGSTLNGVGATSTVNDRSVQTLGLGRLALNFVGANNNPTIGPFTGETGGDWAEAVAEYSTATGTNGMLQLQSADMGLGTIDGGSVVMSLTCDWGNIGLALINADGGVATTACQVASAMRQINASSQDPGSWTISASDDWTATTIAIHPPPKPASYQPRHPAINHSNPGLL